MFKISWYTAHLFEYLVIIEIVESSNRIHYLVTFEKSTKYVYIGIIDLSKLITSTFNV